MNTLSNLPVISSAKELGHETQVITGIGKQFNLSDFDRKKQKIHKRESGLSFPSELTAAGCAMLCLEGLKTNKDIKLLFSGNGRALFPDAAVEFVRRHFPAIAEVNIMEPDRNSVTTQDSVNNIPVVLREHGYTNTVLGTIERHIKRTAYQVEENGSGLITCMAATDSIVAESSDVNQQNIEAWQDTSRVKLDELAEELFFYLDRGPVGMLGEAAVSLLRP